MVSSGGSYPPGRGFESRPCNKEFVATDSFLIKWLVLVSLLFSLMVFEGSGTIFVFKKLFVFIWAAFLLCEIFSTIFVFH